MNSPVSTMPPAAPDTNGKEPERTLDTHGGEFGLYHLIREHNPDTTSTLSGAYAGPIIVDDVDEDARFAAELGRRARRQQIERGEL